MQGLSFFKLERKDKSIWLIMVVLYFAGILVGALYIMSAKNTTVQYIAAFMKQLLEERLNATILTAFSNTFFSSLLINFLILFLGLSCFGAPFILLLAFIKGAGIGGMSCYLYASMGTTGVVKNLISFFPYNIVSSLLILYFCVQAYQSSLALFQTHIIKSKNIVLFRCTNIFRIFVLCSFCILIYALIELFFRMVF